MSEPSVALLGYGYWGKNLARNLHEMGVLKTVCDPSGKARERFQEQISSVAVEASMDNVLQDPNLKAIVLATPAETHFRLAAEAMRNGKDVFVEKPLALRAAEGVELCDLARKLGRILMVGHLLEYHPAVEAMKSLIHKGELGEVNYIYSNRLNFGKIRTEENALWSFAPHDVAVILRLAGGLPESVQCSGGEFLSSGVADVTLSSLRFSNNLRAHIFVSWLNPFKEQKLVVTGAERMAVFDDTSTEKLLLYDQRVDFEKDLPVLKKGGANSIPLPDVEPLRAECEHFVSCIKQRKKPLTDGESGLRVLQVLEACQESLENDGRRIFLNG